MKNKKKWFVRGTLGVLLVGAGLSMVVDAGFYRHAHPEGYKWILYGTGALAVFMAGLTLFVDSIRYK